MKKLLIIFGLALTASLFVDGQTNPPVDAEAVKPAVETLICIRHGEKPAGGLGQLTCRGFNRALALPNVLLGKYGAPDFVFAPNPAQKSDGDKYNYVRPLVTIEPTAIRCGLPVNTEFGYKNIKGLEKEIQKTNYHKATLFIAWEHGFLDDFAKDLIKAHDQDAAQVPSWPTADYDTIFVIKITRDNGKESITFGIDHEGLNNLSDDCH